MLGSNLEIGVAAVMKNEAPYIIEWLAHHRVIGVTKFFIANNDSTDETTDLLDALSLAGLIIHHKFPTPLVGKPHVPAFQMLVDLHKNDVDWMAFIDADEFIFSEDPEFSFPKILSDLANQYPLAGAIAMNWAIYGSSGNRCYGSDPVPQRFIKRSKLNHSLNSHYKTIAKTKNINRVLSPHHVELTCGAKYIHSDGVDKLDYIDQNLDAILSACRSQHICWDYFKINHYVVKSYQEFVQKKSSRGRAFTNNMLDKNFFFGHDINDEESIPDAQYICALNSEISSIKKQLFDLKSEHSGAFLFDAWKSFDIQCSSPQVGFIDSIDVIDEKNIQISGWVVPWTTEIAGCFEISIVDGTWISPLEFLSNPRPDVLKHYPMAPEDCGFTASFSFRINSIKKERFRIRAITRDGNPTVDIEFGVRALKFLDNF